MSGFFQNARADYRPKNAKNEEQTQIQVCNYIRTQYPRVTFRSDYASGLKLTRNQAVKHSKLQSGRSWPDLFIYQPMEHTDKNGDPIMYYGCAIELKADGVTLMLKTGPRKGKLTSNPHIQEQAYMLQELLRLGYYANFAVGFDQAKKLIDWYLKKPVNESLF